MRSVLIGGASLVALNLGNVASAQDGVPPVADTTAGAVSQETGGLAEIVVTARKRTESAQDVPLSVTALSAAYIQRYDLTNLERIAASTPQLTIARSSNGSGAQITLRGIGSTFTSIGIEQSVATVVDGVYYGQGRVINEGFFDLARVEILKGPQSLFFGKNSTAGVVSITTADPTDKLEIMARLGYEFRAQELLSELAVSGPISDTLGFRLAVRGTKMWDGYVRNDAGPSSYTAFDVATGALNTYAAPPAADYGPREKMLLARATLKWNPTSNFTATVKATIDRDRVGNPAWTYITFSCPSGFATFNPAQPCRRDFVNYMNDLPKEIAAVLPYANKDGHLANDYNSYGLTTTLAYTPDNLSITSVSNYYKNNNRFFIDGDYFSSPLTNVWATERTNFRAFSSELRALTTYDGPLNVLAGAYYQNTQLDLVQYALLGGVENSAALPQYRYAGFTKDSGTRDETVAGFGQVIWKVVPTVELTGGVRYTQETKKSRFNQPYINPALAGLFYNDAPFRLNQTFNNWSPEATVTWKPQSNITVYGGYKTGYKSGGFSNSGIDSVGGSRSDLAFAPEKAKGFEAGVKTTLLDRQLRLDLGVYSYKFTNLQIDFFNSTTVSFITTNAGAAKTKGVELEFEYAPRAAPGLSIHGTANYNKAVYANYLAPCYSGQTIAEGCTMVRNGVPFQDLSGQSPTNAPKWTGSLGASYEVDISDSLMFGVSADARYSDDYLASSFGNPVARQPSYVNLDGSIRVKTRDDRWELAVIGRNLTNNFVLTGSADTVGTGSGTGTNVGVPADVYGLVALPRTVQMQVTWRY
jgi:outer membrane receptor protein involved in Fe transport